MRSGKPNEGSLFWSVYTVRMYIFRIFMYNFLSNPCSILCTVSHTFFCVYVHFRDVYIHFVNKCAVSYLSEKCGLRGQATFCRVEKCSLRPRADKCTIVCTNPYVHSYVQIKTKNTFVCTKKPARIYIFYGTVCTIK